ncbi:MAG: potassium transporter TrkA [Persephonella sp.]|nr:MAG: potassium transporter TrkA [Persephonella sp.]RUM59866.1 MAG: potassium transporter TrkA [Persephonella sp.]
MQFRETDLPGIGKKFSIINSEGYKIAVIIHITGKRELFIFEPDDYDDPVCDVVLNEEEANQLASVLMGAYYKPEQENIKEVLIKDLAIEWLKIPPSSPLVGKSIKEENIRMKTGITIIAIIKENNKTIVNPPPDTVLEAGDTIVVVGTREQVEKFSQLYNLNL